jgi:hypothetical protein
VIAEIVSRADQQSTKSNLADGSRARFATARSVPLVEQLMNALQDMLRQGGLLPLNRSGAVGWIYDGYCWFVAKRLADSVREHILARAGEDAGIPGENKNDRLFDCWQEYGQLQLNPTTNQAIWHVVVHGTDGPGYEHSLTMLRFPLDKLWPDLSQAPQPMAGHIEVLTKRKAVGAAPEATASVLAQPQQGTAPTAADCKDAPPPQRPNAGAETGSEAVRRLAGAAVPTPQFESQGSKTKRAAAGCKTITGDGVAPAADEFLPDDESALAASRAAKRAAAAAKVHAPPADAVIARRGAPDPARQALVLPAAPTESPPPSAGTEAVDGYGDETPPWEIPATAPAAPTIGRVALHSDAPSPSERAGKGGREPSETAITFMRWVQSGLADGTVKYNEAGAMVHFVDAGLMLVSPATFRAFAEIHGEPTTANLSQKRPEHQRVGMAVQREVLKSGWHLPSPADGTNIWTFQVARRGGTKVSALSGVVLADARRWVLEPPPPNPSLALPSAIDRSAPQIKQ